VVGIRVKVSIGERKNWVGFYKRGGNQNPNGQKVPCSPYCLKMGADEQVAKSCASRKLFWGHQQGKGGRKHGLGIP